MKLKEIIRKSIDNEEKNINLNPYEYDKVWDKIDCEIDKRNNTISEYIRKITNFFSRKLKLSFSYKDVIQVGLFIAIVVVVPFCISHYSKSYKKNVYVDAILDQKGKTSKNALVEANNNIPLTIEKIKAKYQKVISLNEFKDNYVLVQYSGEYDGSSFDLYNLKTGYKDVVVTNGFSKLIKIINENEFLFLESGQCFESPLWTPPYYLRCIRVKQVANTEGSFKSIIEPASFNLDQSIVFGEKAADMISKVITAEDLLSITFSPAPGKEGMFFAAYSNVPVTSTSYIKDKNQLAIEFKECEIDKKFINFKCNIPENEYISGYEIIKVQKDSKLIIDLKSTAKAYSCSTTDVANGLVNLNIKFKSKVEEPSSLNQVMSLEALLKSYNYNILVNSGYGYVINIPQDLAHSTDIKGLYLKYCNELSKAIGYDISTLNGKTVDVVGYSVNKAGDKSKAFDVISIGLKGELYGVWIREDKTGRLLSLTGESFTEITKKSWQQWLVEKDIKVNDKDIVNEFKNITPNQIFMK